MTLLEKEGSGCRVLLANDKSEDLARMYSLFGRKTEWLQPIATIVRQHIEHVGNEVIDQREARLESVEKEKNEVSRQYSVLWALYHV